MTDSFFAVFRRVRGDDRMQHRSQDEAEEKARLRVEQEPHNEFFVMRTITKYASKRPDIIRTEIDPS